MLFFQQKKCILCFLSLALDLRRPFSRWASLAYRILFLFLCLCLALYSKFVHMTINLKSLILQTTQIQKQFPLSVFVFIDSLVVSALKDAGGYAISIHTRVAFGLPYLLIELFYIGIPVVRTVGSSGGRTVTWLPKLISRICRLPHFLTHGVPLRERSAINTWGVCQTRVHKSLIGNKLPETLSLSLGE